MTNKYLINAQHGADDIEKATVALIVAGAAAAMDSETAVFLTCDAVDMATRNGTDGLGADGYPAPAELIESFVDNGGKLWVCPVCAKARGIGADDLIDGAVITGAATMIGFVNDGAQVLL